MSRGTVMQRGLELGLRCADCRMQRALCLCALVPRLETRTRLVLVLHQLEAHKPTNTGLLAIRCLPNSGVVMRGRDVGAPIAAPAAVEATPPWVEAPERCLLLFPHEDAQPIERWRDHPEPLTLVVPDGTWSQAIRARKRLPGLAALPCAVVPGGDRRYRLRHDPREGNLATLEAIARALGVLEGPAVQEALERIFHIMVDRSLYARGKLAKGEVTGGVPERE